MLAITNTKIILEDGFIWDGTVLCDGETIVDFGESGDVEIPAGAQIIDAGGKYTAPGLVDAHCHGGDMKFFYDDPTKAAAVHFENGTTTLLAAMYQTLTMEQFKEAVDKYRVAKQGGPGKCLDGIYMEGPFMNPKYGSDSGNSKWKGPIDPELMRELVDYVGQDARMWVVAPERDNIEMFCEYAKQVNPQVRFSMGHTECKPWQAYALKKYGLVNQTHHGNATAVVNPIVPTNVGIRDVGPDEAALYDDDIYAELIVDSMAIHVKPHMLRMVTKIKGLDKIVLITDHYPENCENPTGPIWGGKKAPDLGYVVTGEVCGSMMTLNVACRNMMKHTGYGLCHVIKFATINPARMLGIDDKVGSIQKGKMANLIIIDDQVNVEKVIFKGEIQ